MALAKPEEAWEKRTEREQLRRDKKAEKLKAIGYEFEAPELKSAKGVAKKIEKPAVITEGEVEIKAIDAAPAVSAGLEKKEKKKQKQEKVKVKAIEGNKATVEAGNAPVAEKSSKSKKGNQRKAADVEEAPPSLAAVAAAESVEKELKTQIAENGLDETTGEVSEGKSRRSRIKKKPKAAA